MTIEPTMAPPENWQEFLNEHGWVNAAISPVAGDASFRRYFRVQTQDGKSAIFMDAPPPHEDPRPFIALSQYLIGQGFRAPAIYAKDLDSGFVLLEDFGDDRMRDHLDIYPDEERTIYKRAIDTLIALAKVPPAQIALYDEAQYMREVKLLTEWYVPAMRIDVDSAAYDGLWQKLLAPLCEAAHQTITVLRDYHAENIMLLDDGTQGIIDYQDALIGHPAYDLVSLLQDARRDVSPALEQEMLDHYCDATGAGDAFCQAYALLGAQRNAKIIGIFTRLWQRDGKPRYLDFLPRMWALLERDLEHPALAEMKHWFDENIPHAVRLRSPLDAL